MAKNSSPARMTFTFLIKEWIMWYHFFIHVRKYLLNLILPMVLYSCHVGNRAILDILCMLVPTSPNGIYIHLALHSNHALNDNPHDKWLGWIENRILTTSNFNNGKPFALHCTYDLYRIVHPILYCICTQTIHCNNHVDSRAKECIDHIFHHRILNYNDIHRAVCSTHALDRNLFDRLGHHKGHPAILDKCLQM